MSNSKKVWPQGSVGGEPTESKSSSQGLLHRLSIGGGSKKKQKQPPQTQKSVKNLNARVSRFVQQQQIPQDVFMEEGDEPVVQSQSPTRPSQATPTNLLDAKALMELTDLSEKELDDPDSKKWIYSFRAGLFFGFFIFLNFILIAVETDVRGDTESQTTMIIWMTIEVFFLIFFSVEIGLRLREEHCSFFADRFNMFDFFLVATGFIALVIEASTWNPDGKESDSVELDMMTMLRILRLMRLARVVRVFRFFKPLYNLASGMVIAMGSMFWVLLLLLLMIASFGIFITRLLGKNRHLLAKLDQIALIRGMEVTPDLDYTEVCTSFDSPAFENEWRQSDACQLHLAFGGVFRSCWTLFQVTTLENWPTVALLTGHDSLGGSEAGWGVFFIIYIFMSNLMLLNFLTGTIIDSLLLVSKEKEEDLLMKEELETQRVWDALQEIFHFSDTDRSGQLKRSEFIQSLEQDVVRKLFKSIEIEVSDAEDLFTALDLDNSGLLTLEEFLSGFSRCRGVAQSKHIINLNHELYNKTKAMISDTKIEVRDVRNTIVYCLALQEERLKTIMENMDIKVQSPTLSEEYTSIIERTNTMQAHTAPALQHLPSAVISPPPSTSTTAGTDNTERNVTTKVSFSPTLVENEDKESSTIEEVTEEKNNE